MNFWEVGFKVVTRTLVGAYIFLLASTRNSMRHWRGLAVGDLFAGCKKGCHHLYSCDTPCIWFEARKEPKLSKWRVLLGSRAVGELLAPWYKGCQP